MVDFSPCCVFSLNQYRGPEIGFLMPEKIRSKTMKSTLTNQIFQFYNFIYERLKEFSLINQTMKQANKNIMLLLRFANRYSIEHVRVCLSNIFRFLILVLVKSILTINTTFAHLTKQHIQFFKTYPQSQLVP